MIRFRYVVLALLTFGLVVAGCSDQSGRATAPGEPRSLLNTTAPQDDPVHYTQLLVPAGDNRGTALSLMNDIQTASDKDAAAQTFIDFMLNLYGQDALTNPKLTGSTATMLVELVVYLRAIASHYGMTFGNIPTLAEINASTENVVEILTRHQLGNTNGDVCVPTNRPNVNSPLIVGNAAVCGKQNSFKLPTFVSVIEEVDNSSFLMPAGYVKRGRMFHFNDYGSILPPGTGDGAVVVLCVPAGQSHNTNYFLFRAPQSGQLAELKHANAAVQHTCPTGSTAWVEGEGLLARGVNAAGSLLSAAFGPKPLFADHSLAHRGFEFSEWMLGEQVTAYTIELVGVNSGTHTSSHFEVDRNTGTITIYAQVRANGVVEPCSAQHVVQARATFPPPGAWITASNCTFHGATNTQRYQFSIPNLKQGTSVSNGSVAFRVDGIAASNTITFMTVR